MATTSKGMPPFAGSFVPLGARKAIEAVRKLLGNMVRV
jgi:hypothetical protein